MTQVFLFTTGSPTVIQYWPDPGDWSTNNTVECVGCGSGGAAGSAASYAGGAGGGGAYGKASNVIPSFPVSYIVPPSNGFSAYLTRFQSTPEVYAENGKGSPDLTYKTHGGVGGATFSPTGFAGGKGGDAPDYGGRAVRAGADRAPGGGGAAGPNGAGGNGGNSTPTVSGAGGTANGGTVAGGPVGTAGISGTQWDATHGVGSGGGGATNLLAAGRGGQYGGGGGGGSGTLGLTAGAIGGDGLIIITYVPIYRFVGSFAMIMI